MDDTVTTINHTTLEALLFRYSVINGRDMFTNGNVRVTFHEDKPVVSVGDKLVEVRSLDELLKILKQ